RSDARNPTGCDRDPRDYRVRKTVSAKRWRCCPLHRPWPGREGKPGSSGHPVAHSSSPSCLAPRSRSSGVDSARSKTARKCLVLAVILPLASESPLTGAPGAEIRRQASALGRLISYSPQLTAIRHKKRKFWIAWVSGTL